MTDKAKILIISGATAIGKSAVAVEVAKRVGGEIISADSMQVYRRLDIGTGKITQSEMQGIAHHLIDIKEPSDEYSVSEFVIDCKASIDKILNKNKLPIIVGGTGLYINALINGYNFSNTGKSQQLRSQYSEVDSQELHDRLCEVDPESAKKINANDKKRIIRALEIFHLGGTPKSQAISQNTQYACEQELEYDYLFFVLDDEREKIYQRINNRVELMFEKGLMDEVKSLEQFRHCQSMQAIGYKEVLQYLQDNQNIELGSLGMAGLVEKVKQNSRRYAKRQLTYLRWMKADKKWIHYNNIDEICENLAKFM